MRFSFSRTGGPMCPAHWRVLGLLAGTVAIAGLATYSQVQAETDPNNGASDTVMLVFDASGSMRSRMGDETRLDVARSVVKDAVQRWRERGLKTGLVAYGHRDRNSCSDIQTLVPAGRANSRTFNRVIDTIDAKGRTPLGESLRRAAEDLNYRDEKATIVVISDGRENCRADPCSIARSLKRSGAKFVAHVIGFAVNAKDEDGLRCVAEETGGQYVSAGNADSLDGALMRVARTVRPRSHNYADTAELLLPKLKPGTYRLVIRETGEAGSFTATSDLRREPKRVRKKRRRIAMLDAPEKVVARKSFKAGWSGPNISGDRIELLARGDGACGKPIQGVSVREYDTNQDGQFIFLAPMRSGNYELVYCSAKRGRVLARQPIQVVASARDLKSRPRQADATSLWSVEREPDVQTRRSVQLNSDFDKPLKRRPVFDDEEDELEAADDRDDRPTFAEDDDNEPAERRRQPRFDDENDLGDDADESDIVDIAPRDRPRFDDDELPAKSAERSDDQRVTNENLDDELLGLEPSGKAKRRTFAEDDRDDEVETFSQPTRSARKPLFNDEDDEAEPARKPRFDEDEEDGSSRTANRPVFEDDEDNDDVQPRKGTVKALPEEDELRFDDEPEDTRRAALPDDLDEPGDDDAEAQDSDDDLDEVVDREDDFTTDDVGVAQAIARNKARYGDDGEDYFTIRGRYKWYKPITRQDSRQAGRSGETDARDERETRQNSGLDDRRESEEESQGRVIELGSGDDFEIGLPRRDQAKRTQRRNTRVAALPREQDLDDFGAEGSLESDREFYGPPTREELARLNRRFEDTAGDGDDFDSFTSSSTRRTDTKTETAMISRTSRAQVTPQFDRIQPVKAGYAFAAGWTGNMKGNGWVAVSRENARIGDYISLRSADDKGEVKLRAPSKPGRYELRFLSRDRRVVLARQSFEVETAPVRLVALGFVDPSDRLNVWWAGPGDGSDVLTLARVGAGDTRYLSKQSVGKGNPLTITAPSEPGTYEMRYVNGTD
ncbi:MAG: VWA domain-containing protein, partial [Hyphomicrobiaceae bacterium]